MIGPTRETDRYPCDILGFGIYLALTQFVFYNSNSLLRSRFVTFSLQFLSLH